MGFCLSAAAWAQQDDGAAAQKADPTPAKAESSPDNEKEANEPQRRHIGDVVRFANDAVIKEGEDAGDVVVIFGDATVDGRASDVVVVFGTAKVNGTIRGDFVVPLGSAELGPNAHIEGDTVIVGGDLHADPSARNGPPRRRRLWVRLLIISVALDPSSTKVDFRPEDRAFEATLVGLSGGQPHSIV